MVTPASSSRTEVIWPPTLASRNSAPVAAIAPRNALAVNELAPTAAPIPNRIVAAAPVEAPEVTPRMSGSARTLRTIACSATPVRARPVPKTAPSSTRGIRTNHTMLSSAPDQFAVDGQPSR